MNSDRNRANREDKIHSESPAKHGIHLLSPAIIADLVLLLLFLSLCTLIACTRPGSVVCGPSFALFKNEHQEHNRIVGERIMGGFGSSPSAGGSAL